MTDVPVVVIGGYLGAGKTTFINRVLVSARDRITVIVNDFGSVNIDASLIRNASGDTIELTNGCVCCSVGDDLVGAMYGIVDSSPRPDLVIIETSGVADPRIASSYAHIPGLRAGAIMVMVDATQLDRQLANRMVSGTVTRQIEAADVLLVTKLATDTNSGTDKGTTGVPFDGIASRVRSMNGSAPIVNADGFDPLLLTAIEPRMVRAQAQHGTAHSSRTEHITARDRDEVLASLGSLGPAVVRAKGIVATRHGNLLAERVGNHCTAAPTDLPPTDGIVVISTGGDDAPEF